MIDVLLTSKNQELKIRLKVRGNAMIAMVLPQFPSPCL